MCNVDYRILSKVVKADLNIYKMQKRIETCFTSQSWVGSMANESKDVELGWGGVVWWGVPLHSSCLIVA